MDRAQAQLPRLVSPPTAGNRQEPKRGCGTQVVPDNWWCFRQLRTGERRPRQGISTKCRRVILDTWLNDSVRDNVRPRTFHNYRLQVRQQLDEGLKPCSVRYIHAVLHRALRQAVRWGLVPHNVSEAVDIPKLVGGEVNAFSPEEARTFLAAARGDHLEALYVLLSIAD